MIRVRKFIILSLYIILALLSSLFSFCQPNHDIDTKKPEGTETIRLGFIGKSESIYKIIQNDPKGKNGAIVFLITPGAAPRFENFPNLVYDEIMQKGYKGTIFAIINFDKYYQAIKYIQERNYQFPCYFDSTGKIFKELNLATYPPFVTRWDSSGTIQYSQCLYGVSLDSNLWNEIINKEKTYSPENNSKSISKNGFITDTFNLPELTLIKSIKLEEDSLHPNGKFYNLDISQNEKFFVANDFFDLKNKIFSLENGKLISTILPDAKMRKFFSKNIPDYIFDETEQKGYARTMLFQSKFLTNENILIISVFPEVKLDIKGADTNVQLYNKYALLKYNFYTNKFLKIIPIIFNEGESTMVEELSIMKDLGNNEIALTYAKGYPTKGFSTSDTANGNNPIDKSFYNDTPLYYTYDIKTGETKRKIGKLWGANAKLGVGYALGGSQLCSNSSTYFYTSALSPYIETGNIDKIPLKTYYPKHLMEPGDPPKELPTYDKIEQLSDSIGAFIVSMAASDRYLYTIWRLKESGETLLNSNIYILQKYDLISKNLIGEWLIPGVIDGRKLNSYMVEPNKNQLVGIYYNSMETYVDFFDIK